MALVTLTRNADDEIFAIGLQSDAKLVAAGECDQPSTGRDVCVARYKVERATSGVERMVKGLGVDVPDINPARATNEGGAAGAPFFFPVC